MLSRVADRLYWMARYLERAESSARLLNVYSQAVLDLPSGVEPGWDTLLRIGAGEEVFHQRYQNVVERNVAKFLLVDADNPGSIASSIRMARENARTTREILPEEAWELINGLHIELRAVAQESLSRRRRYEVLQGIIGTSLQLTGLLEGALQRGLARRFMSLGRYVERADTSSRVLDVGAGLLLLDAEGPQQAYESLLWMRLLESLNALHAYRTTVGPCVDAELVLDFVINDTEFPRALRACIEVLDRTISALPRPEQPRQRLGRVRRRIERFSLASADGQALHRFVDSLQQDMIALHESFDADWFHFQT